MPVLVPVIKADAPNVTGRGWLLGSPPSNNLSHAQLTSMPMWNIDIETPHQVARYLPKAVSMVLNTRSTVRIKINVRICTLAATAAAAG